MADAMDPASVWAGAMTRFLRETQPIDFGLMEEFRAFNRRTIRGWFGKLNPLDIDFLSYIESTSYTRVQKDKFIRIHADLVGVPTGLTYKGFGKVEFMNISPGQLHESYVKTVRCINGPPDKWKVYAGHILHMVEKTVCKLPYFAKYIPVCQRPQAIVDRLGHLCGPYYVTDYTSFESGFSEAVLDAAEGELYRHMLADFPHCPHIIKQMKGFHNIRYKGFQVKVPATRMSGDPQTSLGNGFTNLMIMLFTAYKAGIEVDGFVEGDDGLFAFSGVPDFDVGKRLGFEFKFAPHSSLWTTSFCGLMLSRSLGCFADPAYEIIKFGWSTSTLRHSPRVTVHRGLLRAKALSLFYCFPRCPMITSLAIKMLSLTSGVKPVFSRGYWEDKVALETLKFESYTSVQYAMGISEHDRVDFEAIYGVSIHTQIAFERYMKELPCVCQLDHWSIDELCQGKPYMRWMAETHAENGVAH